MLIPQGPLFAVILIIVALLVISIIAYFRGDQPLLSFISIVAALVAIIVAVLIANGILIIDSNFVSKQQEREFEETIEGNNPESEGDTIPPENTEASESIAKTEYNSKIDKNGHLHYGGHTYSTVLIPYEFKDSFSNENKNFEYYGGHLAIINDANENNILFNFVSNSSNWKSVYFGLTDEGHKGDWKWVDGSPCVYNNWSNGQPDNHNGNDYALFFHEDMPGTWRTGDFSINPEDEITLLVEWDDDLEDPLKTSTE